MSEVRALGNDYPFLDSEATRLVATAVRRLQHDEGLSQRELANKLGYKTSVVLSHICIGRVPVPLDKFADFAEVLGLEPRTLLLAILEQRFPEIDFRELLNISLADASALKAQIEAVAGSTLDEMDVDTKHLLLEVVGTARPRARWMALTEMYIIDSARRQLGDGGLIEMTAGEQDRIEAVFAEIALARQN
jgi:transcriptional regulator with XRE-family HTH domain